ncbi:MAG: hypothetical protein HY074_02840 [Deltaproteobacteria bacterium]|nr:hypothetical protein [Deltaproteobacteria bacterium]
MSAMGLSLLLPQVSQAQQALAGPGGNTTLGKQCSGDSAKDDPTVCGHSRMLEQGDTVFAIYQLHAKKKAKLVKDAFQGTVPAGATAPTGGEIPNNMAKFKKDGTCLPGDTADQAGADACSARLDRMAVDAELQARKETLHMNKGRADLLQDKNGTILQSSIKKEDGTGAAPPPTSGGATETVFKDIVEDVQPVDKKTAAMKLLAQPQPVSFTDKAGNAIAAEDTLKAREGTAKSKQFKIEDTNADEASRRDGTHKVYEEEVVDSTGKAETDTALDKAVKGNPKLDALIKNDQEGTRKLAADPKNGAFKPNGESVSAQALHDVVQELAQRKQDNDIKAGAKPTGKPVELSILNTESTNMNISKDTTTNGGKALGPKDEKIDPFDKTITSDLNNLGN